jgi:hypothetical protein
MRQQVGEADEFFPVRGCVGETVIETAINHQIPPKWIRERPQVADRIRIENGAV